MKKYSQKELLDLIDVSINNIADKNLEVDI